jgi:hypothetical protein
VKRSNVSRRTLLIGFALLGGSGSIATYFRFFGPPGLWTPSEELLRIFRQRQDIVALGNLYLERYPEEADASRLIEKILAGEHAPLEPLEALRQFLRRRVELDYERGNVFVVNHWKLSVTEGQLCALAALAAR